jgi:catechol-2,3-dioxygenase
VLFTLCDGVEATRAPRPTNHRGTEVTMAQNIAIERVDHIGVRVRNLDRALAFYRVLGFAVVRRAEGDDVAIIRNEHGVELRRASLLVVGLIGAALLYGDGVITPAISVLSAQAPS